MIKKLFFLTFFLAFLFPVSPVLANETIPAFDVRIGVNKNATIEVSERIEYDFGANKKHGIFRNIPYSYQAGTETYTADVSSVIVTDDVGNPRPFAESRGNGELTLTIGDPNIEVTGKQTYVISYVVEGPFLYFDEHDELYWNVTGFWEKSITHATVLLDLPVGAQVLSASCYKGVDGSSNPCDSSEKLFSDERAGYRAEALDLKAQEGLTVAVAFPKGVISVIEKPWEKENKTGPLDAWPLIIPILVFGFMFKKWYQEGRDPKGKSSIVTQFFPPPELTPSLSGVVFSEKVKGKELSAEIVRLAVAGYIKIHRFENKILFFTTTDYLLERIGKEEPKDEIGKMVLQKLFQASFEGEEEIQGAVKKGTVLSKMKHEFVEEKKAIDTKIYETITSLGYFKNRPDKVRAKYWIAGFILFFGSFFVGGFLSEIFSNFFILIALGVSGFIIMVIGTFMPVRTEEGVRMREYLEGFKRYLGVAEKDRIDFHSSPEQDSHEPQKTMTLFDACLPYAMIFGVEEKWAEKFKDIYLEEPKWYSGGYGQAFAAGAFASDLSSFSNDVAQASMPQSSGAGGGGSSGGGFGGGGGGSW